MVLPRSQGGGQLTISKQNEGDDERVGTSFETAGEDDDNTMNTDGLSFS